MSWGSDVPASNYSRRAVSVDAAVAARLPSGQHTWDQYSMILVRNGVMPGFRTGLTVTLPALPDASSI